VSDLKEARLEVHASWSSEVGKARIIFTIVAQKLQAFRQDRYNLFIYPTCNITTIKSSIGDQGAFKGTALAFFDEFGSAPCLWLDYLSESSDLSPCIVRTVGKSILDNL